MINPLIIQEVVDQPLCIESNFAMGIAMAIVSMMASPFAVHENAAAVPMPVGKYEAAYAVEASTNTRQVNNFKAGSVGIVTIDGPILENSDPRYGIMGTVEAGAALRSLEADPNIIGNVFVMESGGGAAFAVKSLRDIVNSRTKPLVVFSKKIIASAAFGSIAGADSIIMYHPQGIVGSFGTMSSSQDMQPMFEKWGMKFNEFYATASTLKNKTSRDAKNGKPEAYIKNVLDPLNEVYIGGIKADRGERISKTEPGIYQGETYMASQAVELGLIDSLGTLDDAIAEVVRLHNAKTGDSSQSNNLNANMDFPKLTSLSGQTSATPEVLAQVTAELAAAGITGFTIVASSAITDHAAVTSERNQLVIDKTNLTNQLTAANASVGALTTENTDLKAKVAAAPASAAAASAAVDPATEKTAAEKVEATVSGFAHNKHVDEYFNF